MRSTASRRIKVAMRKLSKEAVHDAEVIRGIQELKKQIRNKA